MTWVRHVASAALGIAFVMAIEVVTRLERDLRAVQLRDVVPWPSWAITGMFLLLGAALLVIMLVSPRMPWLPTTAATGPRLRDARDASGRSGERTAIRWPLGPSVRWGLSTVSLVAGLMTATAVWSWWRFHRHAVDT